LVPRATITEDVDGPKEGGGVEVRGQFDTQSRVEVNQDA
jgi:hypothetical protein